MGGSHRKDNKRNNIETYAKALQEIIDIKVDEKVKKGEPIIPYIRERLIPKTRNRKYTIKIGGEKKSLKVSIELRQHRVYRDKKIAKGRRRERKAKRGRATPIFCSERTIIRPRDQNAYQRDRGLQEQTKYSI